MRKQVVEYLHSMFIKKGITLFDWTDFVFEHHVEKNTLLVNMTDNSTAWQRIIDHFFEATLNNNESLKGVYVSENSSIPSRVLFVFNMCYTKEYK